jgi:hypothetical protein
MARGLLDSAAHDRNRPAHFTPARLRFPRHAPLRRTFRRTVALALLVAAAPLAGCGSDADGRDRASNGDVARVDAQPPVIPDPASPYREAQVAGGGTITGVAVFRGDLPDASRAPDGADAECTSRARQAPSPRRTGDRLGDAVVWLADARTGKPLPLERRYAMSIAGCDYAPRVQAVLAGGTLNVLNEDAVDHRTTLVRQASRETTDDIPQFLPGQIVPVRDALARTGLVEVACAKHPWSRAWVAVFDHPYHDITSTDGAFALDQVPPGDYTLMAWHAALGRVEQKVTVAAGGTVSVEVRFEKE